MKPHVLGLLSLVPLLIPHSSLARDEPSCRVFAGDLYSVYEGYPIVYEDAVTRVLKEKGYSLVFREEVADFLLTISISSQKKGVFERAIATFNWKEATASETSIVRSEEKRCWTEFCLVADFLPPLRKLTQSMERKIPDCPQRD